MGSPTVQPAALKTGISQSTVRARSTIDRFDHLYHDYVDRIFRYCYSHTGNRQDAEDLTAQVFLKALEGWDRYEERNLAGAWLFGIARNLCACHHRGHYAHPEVTLSPELEACFSNNSRQAEGDPEGALAEKAVRGCVRRALARLSDDQQEALRLRFWGKLTAAEIGAVLSKKEGAVKMLIWRGIRELRRRCADGP